MESYYVVEKMIEWKMKEIEQFYSINEEKRNTPLFRLPKLWKSN